MRGGHTWRALRALAIALVVGGMLLGMSGSAPARAGAASPGADSRFGLTADIGTRHPCDGQHGPAVETAARLGVGWVKEEFRWDWVEPSRDNFTWTCMDRVVADERARGLEILGLLDFTAGWAVGEDRPVSPTPPPLDRWTNYVRQTVGRYKDQVRAWEVWNEPNFAHFWAGSREQYAALLVATYDTIKAVDPTALVLAPAVSGVGEAEAWLAAIPQDKYDVLALHIYTDPRFLNDRGYSYFDQGLPNLRDLVRRHGDKPVWITEFGFSSQGGGQPWFVGDEAAQARYLLQQVIATLAYDDGMRIARIMPYVFNDHDGFELVRDWTTPKAAYRAYQVAIGLLDGATPRGRIAAGAGVLAFRFERDGQQIDVAWAPDGGTATIPSGGDAEVVDLYGVRSAAAAAGGVVRLPVGPDPVYVVHPPEGGAGGDFTGSGQHFAETGRNVRGPFLAYWQAHGGLALNGLPISDEFVQTLEDGKPYLVQYFERVRLEWHPESADPRYRVQLGQFGRLIRPPDPPVAPLDGQRYFAETGHNLGGAFRAYWEANGGLAQFGFPLGEESVETLEDGQPYTVQYFERARLEWHPANEPGYQVLLGQFGRWAYSQIPAP